MVFMPGAAFWGEKRSPRILIDFEQGAAFRDTAASVDVFEQFAGSFESFTQAWLFHSDAAPLTRGFSFPAGSHERYGIPRGLGPHCVLIDARGDQLWLDGISCGGAGERVRGAIRVLRTLGFAGSEGDDPELTATVAASDELAFLGDRIVTSRSLSEPPPVSPPGKTYVSDGRLVNRLEFDKGANPLNSRLKDTIARSSTRDSRNPWTLARMNSSAKPRTWL